MSTVFQNPTAFYIPVPAKLKEPFRILPSGNFGSLGSRNQNFFLNEANGQALANQVNALSLALKVSLGADGDGDQPAAGWFKRLAWRQDGLYVLDLVLAKRGVDAIVNDEYRYIAPVFYADTNIPRQLIGLVLTNDPSLRSRRYG